MFFLAATAAVACGLGIALGSSLRFQVLSVSQTPLFKPQQDFPPLAEWPPQVPLPKKSSDFDRNWENAASSTKLDYDDNPVTSVEPYDTSKDVLLAVEDDGHPLEEASLSETSPDFSTELGDRDNNAQDIASEDSNEAPLPPIVSTETGEFNAELEFVDELPIDHNSTIIDTPPWFNKTPVSDGQLTDGPIIITPDESIPASNVLPN